MEARLTISARKIASSSSSAGQNISRLQRSSQNTPGTAAKIDLPKGHSRFERSTMAYDPDLKTKVLGVLETSDDPDASLPAS